MDRVDYFEAVLEKNYKTEMRWMIYSVFEVSVWESKTL